MRSAKKVDLVKERRKLEKVEPGLVKSYKEFLTSFAQYREIEARFSRTGESQREPAAQSSEPAAISGWADD